jgi:hypothetical protein
MIHNRPESNLARTSPNLARRAWFASSPETSPSPPPPVGAGARFGGRGADRSKINNSNLARDEVQS